MRIEYDRDTCIGMFQCTAEWDGLVEDNDAGKAVLTDGEASDADWGADVRVQELPSEAELDAKFAARSCPVDAIRIYDGDERVV
ncbi:ferredoxin [Halosegnis rubeus]|jgi:ferredoxin|uniref:Ferredoxin n=1 Tax=Halosegnis rubeus TaxID=2212850 RepID=A0A5N5U9Q3_9EURY|nr:ferredoxin [Halosegnis rubeus]KAB7515238.1 ferredoxin [Halosegnis rubeus]KAB7516292.1 ferredoxin [Halosegnis rubeus]KAB7517720.1 ferredoxin [Halosegnis rubeus]